MPVMRVLVHERMSVYYKLPSGRQVRTVDTRKGWSAIHIMAGGQWEVTRGGKRLGAGSVWNSDTDEAKRRAESFLSNIIETEG